MDIPAPVVLVVHQWKGLGEHEKSRAEQIAAQCYNAFAVDMYGKGVRPATSDAAGAEAGKYKNNPALARQRLKAALDWVRKRDDVDVAHIAAMGYCFGGTMVLELARGGEDIDAVISFHGGLASPAPITKPGILKAAVQVHHGASDPFVPQEEVQGFITEMKTAKADWHLTQYADAVHAFTHADAGSDPSGGVAYNAKADKRSWAATTDFLTEIFGR